MSIIGIDLGTTNSLVSVYQNGRIQLIPNSFGEYLTPSVVSINKSGEVFVGKVAKEMLVTNPQNTFQEFKRNMGTDYIYTAGKKEYRPEELSAFILRRLKEDAERYLGEPVTEAIISVPAYFNDDKRCATRNAGLLAGLEVNRLINEPSAVALKHHLDENEFETFIIFDFGGGTLDVSLVDAFDNVVEIQAVAGDNYLGGKDFNEVIAKHFYETNHLQADLLSSEEKNIVLKEAELLKRDLSLQNSAERKFYIQNQEYRMALTNQELIHLSADLFKRMTEPIRKVINDAHASLNDIDKIILVGGSSKMPIVQQYIKSLWDIEVVVDKHPDESIGLGVGVAAAIKERTGDVRDVILADICPFSLGVKIHGDIFSPIIERNSTLPCRRTNRYITINDNQSSITFEVYQGENLYANENLYLCELKIDHLPPGPKGSQGADVTFMYDINGILDIEIVSFDKQEVHKVITNKNLSLSGSALKKRLDELHKMTLHPLEQEENRLLIERAERIYRECAPEQRKQISILLSDFKELAGAHKVDQQRLLKLRAIFSGFLDHIEENSFDFEEFDESFFKPDDQ